MSQKFSLIHKNNRVNEIYKEKSLNIVFLSPSHSMKPHLLFLCIIHSHFLSPIILMFWNISYLTSSVAWEHFTFWHILYLTGEVTHHLYSTHVNSEECFQKVFEVEKQSGSILENDHFSLFLKDKNKDGNRKWHRQILRENIFYCLLLSCYHHRSHFLTLVFSHDKVTSVNWINLQLYT